MCEQPFRSVRSRIGALLVAGLVIGNAGQAAAQNPSPASGGPREGIQVHGNWVIEVRNPDGSLADRREFKNALHSQGSSALTAILGRQRSTGFWGISVAGSPSPCVGSLAGCGIYETATGETLPNLPAASVNLQLSVVPNPGGNPIQIRVSGSATATAATSINMVYTFVAICSTAAPATPPCTPTQSETYIFSQTLAGSFTPVAVVVGQIIQVTVTFSFS